jgi:type III secretory pathway component EscS
MLRRTVLAAFVWIIGMVFAAGIVGIVIAGVTASTDLGASQTNPIVISLLIVGPGLAGAALTRLTTRFISPELNPEFHIGPSVVGCAAGIALCWVLVDDLRFILAIGPMTGALAGSFVPARLPPLTAGALVAVVSAIAVAIDIST